MTAPSPGSERSAEFRAPLTLPGGSTPGLDTMAELPPGAAVPTWRVLRTVLLWAAEEPDDREALLESLPLREWEEKLLTDTFDADLRLPLAVVVGELARGPQTVATRVSWACLCVADWALAHRASRTALGFAEAAALVSPDHPRYAWVAGRILRTFGRFKDSGLWLRRAVRIATRSGDWEAQSRGLNSLGGTWIDRGDYREARRLLLNALRSVQRRRVRSCEGETLHNLFVVHYALGEWSEAEKYARAAFDAYRPGHERLPALAHDVAFFWLERGYFSRALTVLLALEPLLASNGDRLHLLASSARAAGAAGDPELFQRLWSDAWALVTSATDETRVAASALVELAVGASSLSRWDQAREALELAHELAKKRGEQDVVFRVETAMVAVRAQRTAETARSAPRNGSSVGDALARSVVASLASAVAKA
jgi:tetratricopeptide (TPR) repeat protein